MSFGTLGPDIFSEIIAVYRRWLERLFAGRLLCKRPDCELINGEPGAIRGTCEPALINEVEKYSGGGHTEFVSSALIDKRKIDTYEMIMKYSIMSNLFEN